MFSSPYNFLFRIWKSCVEIFVSSIEFLSSSERTFVFCKNLKSPISSKFILSLFHLCSSSFTFSLIMSSFVSSSCESLSLVCFDLKLFLCSAPSPPLATYPPCNYYCRRSSKNFSKRFITLIVLTDAEDPLKISQNDLLH